MNVIEAGKNSNYYITLPVLDAISGVRHVFTTRRDGLGSRTGGFKTPDDWNAVADAFGIPHEKLITVQQVHGDALVLVDNANCRDARTREADALITNAAGIALGIETADCVPILLYDPVRRAAGAVHAGWRSTVKQIAAKAVCALQQEFGSDPADVIAAFGPAIGPECYEVDEPVMGPMRQAFPFWAEVSRERGPGKWSLDLVRTNTRVLLGAGLAAANIHSLGMCTCCRRDLFYSFRAEGRTGRMLSAIVLQP